jgi:U3 small nucleolar RNA-associated protein 4
MFYRAMSFIDFTAPVPQDEVSLVNGRASAVSNGLMQSSEHQNGTSKGHHKNFVMVPFKDPVLFVGHVSKNSIVVVEKPWLEAVKQLPPPVDRHRYGT